MTTIPPSHPAPPTSVAAPPTAVAGSPTTLVAPPTSVAAPPTAVAGSPTSLVAPPTSAAAPPLPPEATLPTSEATASAPRELRPFPPLFASVAEPESKESKRIRKKALKEKLKAKRRKEKVKFKVKPVRRPFRKEDDYLYELPATEQKLVDLYNKYIGFKQTSLVKEKQLMIQAVKKLKSANKFRFVSDRCKYVPLEPLGTTAPLLERGPGNTIGTCTCPFRPCICDGGITNGTKAIPTELRMVCWKNLTARIRQWRHPKLPSPAHAFMTRVVYGVNAKVNYYKKMDAPRLRAMDPLFCLAEQFPHFVCNRLPNYEYRQMMRVLKEMQARQDGEWQEEIPKPVCITNGPKDICSVWTQTHVDSDGELVVGKGRVLFPRGATGALPPLCHIGGAKLRIRPTINYRPCSPTLFRKTITKVQRLSRYLRCHAVDAAGVVCDIFSRGDEIPDPQCLEACRPSAAPAYTPPAPLLSADPSLSSQFTLSSESTLSADSNMSVN